MTRPPLKVCLVSPLPPPAGGIARWTQLVTQHLKSTPGIEVSVVDTALRLRSPQSTSSARRLLSGSLEGLWALLRFGWRLLRTRPDVVHVNVSGQFGLVRDLAIVRLARLVGIPGLVHLRFGRVPELAQQETWEWRLLLRLFRASRLVVAIDSRTLETIELKCPGVDVELIPNCVALESETGTWASTSDAKVVLFVGWLVPTKGVEELLVAWDSVRRPGWKLKLVGGYDDTYLAALKGRLPVPADVEILGELSHADVRAEFRECSVFVLPSHTEGFPNVVVEAMAAGAPVVATDVGAVRDMLAEGSGVVVPPRDTVALTAALDSLMSDTELAAALGRAGRSRALLLYGVEPVVRRYLAAWGATANKQGSES